MIPFRPRRPARTRVWLVLAATLLGCPDAGDPITQGAGAKEPAPRRALLVTVDTLRADHVGAYGAAVPTPNLDRLADHSIVVETAYTPVPTTGPAHASLLTGLHPWRHGVLDNAVPLVGEAPTVAVVAREAGLATAAFVSSYILDRRFGLDRGFDVYHFEPFESYRWRGQQRRAFWARGSGTTEAALGWLAEHRDDSFFVWVHYFDPHAPYDPPDGYERPPEEPVAIAGKALPPGVPSFVVLQRLIRAYRGEVSYVDAQIGRLLAGLEDLGMTDSTAVVLTADHGEGLGDHGLLEHGDFVFDELVRVPLFVRAAGLPAGTRLQGLAQLEDLAPTLLRLLDLPVPPSLDGFDLLPWMRGEQSGSPRATVLGRRKHYDGRPELYFERWGDEKWIGAPGAGGLRFQLDVDPAEGRGIHDARVPEALAAVLASTATTPAAPDLLDATTREALEALGYLEE